MDKNYYKELANIIVNEINPKVKKGHNFPEVNTTLYLSVLKYRKLITHYQLRRLLCKFMGISSHLF